MQTALDSFGRLDVLVNNAGFLRDRMIVSTSEEEWDAVIRVHLKGHFAPTRFAGAYWREQQKAGSPVDARVINTSSGAGLMGSVGQGAYSAAKAGIAALTMVESAELGRYGVTANAIAPAARTRMTEAVFADTMAAPDGDAFDAMAPENVAPLVVWLGSAESAGVTGRVFEVEGGISVGGRRLAARQGDRQGRALGPGRARPDRPRAPRRGSATHARLRRVVSDLVGDEILEHYGVTAHARLRPDKVAIVAGERRITYAELDGAVSAMARVLRARGVGPDARLGIALRNRPEWIMAALATARLGAQVVPIPSGATADELEYFCHRRRRRVRARRSGVAGVPRRGRRRVDRAARRRRPRLRDAARRTRRARRGSPRPCSAPSRRRCSRSTAWSTTTRPTGSSTPSEVNITGSPLHHIAGFSGPHSALLLGHTTILLEHFDAAEWLAAIERERVTYTWCAPVHLYRVMQLPESVREAADVSSIKRVLHGSAPCPPSVKRGVMELFPPGAVWETYGGTETMGTVISAEEWLRKPGSVGRAAPGSTIKILDDDGDELPTGEVGLVYIGSDWGRGFRYAGPDVLTESVYRGELATLGDLGYVDEDGYLFVVDRRKDMVITGGANVYPAEVEAVLVGHPAIGEVAVIGLPDDEYGEIVTAVVVADGEITRERDHRLLPRAPRSVQGAAARRDRRRAPARPDGQDPEAPPQTPDPSAPTHRTGS